METNQTTTDTLDNITEQIQQGIERANIPGAKFRMLS